MSTKTRARMPESGTGAGRGENFEFRNRLFRRMILTIVELQYVPTASSEDN